MSTARLDQSLKDLTEEFCRTNSVKPKEELTRRISVALNCFSADNTESCDVQLSERKLRIYFLQSDQHSIEVRVNIYCRHLAVMLQRCLQPETIHGENNTTVVRLRDRLKDMVKPSEYYPTSSLRKDIENVIDMLSLYSTKSNKQQKTIIKCFSELTSESCFDKNIVKSCLDNYLKQSPIWIHLYLIISWLKTKVLLHKVLSSLKWKLKQNFDQTILALGKYLCTWFFSFSPNYDFYKRNFIKHELNGQKIMCKLAKVV